MASMIRRVWSQITGASAKEKEDLFFIENGSELYKGLVASCDGKYHPFRNFTAEEIISMTNNFKEPMINFEWHFYKGCVENRHALIHKYTRIHSLPIEYMINDIVLISRACHHRNILKLLGCCLEFEFPALVFEYPSGGKSLYDLIYNQKKGEPLQWKSRLKIARDIADILVYLHTAFPTPIIYRNLSSYFIIVGESGVAKLFDFSYSIPLPPGKTEMKHSVWGTIGFTEPEYMESGIVTTKIDVYSFGVILLVLLTGQKVFQESRRHKLVADMNEYVGEGRLKKIADPILLSKTEEYGRLQAFLELAERCILKKREDRPEMIDVAKELKRIERFSSIAS